ncbi:MULTISPECIES: NmrA family NAD(P)-binding protein [unclassified Streptomyces]|uniref:SDR family oxidoreductase n=1 Tax=unclassified Streptomyces TaxID=2593676 RepID=UPI00344ECA4F
MNYVIHGATGAQGAPVVSALAAAGKPVVALTRRAGASVAGKGVRTATADYSSTERLTAAYQSAEGVFIHLPLGAEADRVQYAHNVVAAIREASPSRVIFSTSGSGGGALQEPAGSAVSTLIGGLEAGDVSYAVIQPRLFLENLLPQLMGAVREEGVLRYPLRADFPVSWSSHLDVADVAVALFDRPDVTGTVAVGQLPAITGPDLADAFSAHLRREVSYEAITPSAFGALLAPLFGEGPAAGVAGLYQALGALTGNVIAPERAAQTLLGLSPRATGHWLADVDR